MQQRKGKYAKTDIYLIWNSFSHVCIVRNVNGMRAKRCGESRILSLIPSRSLATNDNALNGQQHCDFRILFISRVRFLHNNCYRRGFGIATAAAANTIRRPLLLPLRCLLCYIINKIYAWPLRGRHIAGYVSVNQCLQRFQHTIAIAVAAAATAAPATKSVWFLVHSMKYLSRWISIIDSS